MESAFQQFLTAAQVNIVHPLPVEFFKCFLLTFQPLLLFAGGDSYLRLMMVYLPATEVMTVLPSGVISTLSCFGSTSTLPNLSIGNRYRDLSQSRLSPIRRIRNHQSSIISHQSVIINRKCRTLTCPVLPSPVRSLCEQAIQCHFAVYYTSVTAFGYTERCDEGVDQ